MRAVYVGAGLQLAGIEFGGVVELHQHPTLKNYYRCTTPCGVPYRILKSMVHGDLNWWILDEEILDIPG